MIHVFYKTDTTNENFFNVHIMHFLYFCRVEPLKLTFSIIIAIFENTYRKLKFINLSTSSLGIFGQASESFFTLLLKSNAPHCNLLQGSEEQMVARGFWNHVFSV